MPRSLQRAAKLLIVCVVVVMSNTAFGNDGVPITSVEQTPPPIDFQSINRIWKWLTSEIGAPADFPPPPLALDWEVPLFAKMGFQYPTEEYPNTRLQISIAPRTIDMESPKMLLFGIGHELAHYLFLLRDNDYNLAKHVFAPGKPHHCDLAFMEITRGVADLIWSMHHDSPVRDAMYAEIDKSCQKYPGQ